jgi:hypothetical protein
VLATQKNGTMIAGIAKALTIFFIWVLFLRLIFDLIIITENIDFTN